MAIEKLTNHSEALKKNVEANYSLVQSLKSQIEDLRSERDKLLDRILEPNVVIKPQLDGTQIRKNLIASAGKTWTAARSGLKAKIEKDREENLASEASIDTAAQSFPMVQG